MLIEPIRLMRPVLWVGSMMIGRWLNSFMAGMALRSSVLRV
jgi:hypothetical protein